MLKIPHNPPHVPEDFDFATLKTPRQRLKAPQPTHGLLVVAFILGVVCGLLLTNILTLLVR